MGKGEFDVVKEALWMHVTRHSRAIAIVCMCAIVCFSTMRHSELVIVVVKQGKAG